ncbi:MAG: hypothetical protein WB462_05315 [Solirubrobacterales bacterium]
MRRSPANPLDSEAPPEVLKLARAGNKMEAAKRYRELTGADG